MAPLPQEPAQAAHTPMEPTEPIADDDLVISGVSGLFPNCDSFQEFAERLYNKENMVTTQSGRWSVRHPELKTQLGQIRGIDCFDAQFFTVFHRLADSTEPIAKKMFEQTYQAIFDSGICPNELSQLFGGRVGVFMTATVCCSEKLCASKDANMGLLGCSRNMFANRVSYFLGLTGPSMTMDGDSAGSLLALDKVCQAIKHGYCDAAIVGSGKLVMHPQLSIIHNRTTSLNSDGKTKCYDAGADGPSISEAISVMFIQKYKDAKRVYAVLKHAEARFAVSHEDVNTEILKMPRDVELLTNFYREFYDQVGVSPAAVKYVEGFGIAVPELDKLELQVMDEVFCQERQDPLLVGSVTSNVGYTDSVSGMCGIAKILLGYQRGQLAGNLHCGNPRQDVAAVRDGRLRIVTDHTPFRGSYAAVNSLSDIGLNAHALLQRYPKEKDISKYHSTIPYLVTASGRQESAVLKILDSVESQPLDPEEIALLHNIHRIRITKHLARGFGVFSPEDNKTAVHCKKVDYYDDVKQPLWFVYSGMGSQWVGMGAHLMRIPVVAESIVRCHKVLEPKGIDLINIITTQDKEIFNNVLHSFIGITAIQIALTDLLTTVGLIPDKIMGHSLGELGCAYADGCLTTEEAMMLSYFRGLASISIPLDRGAMAAVGMGYKQLSKICPPEIDIACHNSSMSSTISGPVDDVHKFVARLTKEGVFAKEVQCSNIAYHSRYIQNLGPALLQNARELLKSPTLRSERWVSTSVPKEKWNQPDAMYSSAEYHVNNLLNTVLFEEALRCVPPTAVLVEVAPHCLLGSILKHALPSCRLVPLTRRAHPDNALLALEGIGNLFMAGYDPDVSALYPKVEFPVSTSTRSLGHLVEWAHNEKWKVCTYVHPERKYCSVFKQIVSLHDDEYEYLKGHVIEGTRVIPYAACLVAAWDCLAMTLGRERRKLSVQFQKVRFHCQLPLRDSEPTYLYTSVQRGSGVFEVHDGNNTILVEGVITPNSQKFSCAQNAKNEDANMCLNKEDIYKLFSENGYHYKDQFRSIHSLDASMTHGLIEWNDNWVTFIDAIIQTNALLYKQSGMSSPKTLEHMMIDFKDNVKERINGGNLLEINYDAVQSSIRCGGVTIEHFQFKQKIPTKGQSMSLKSLKFVPFDQPQTCDVITAMNTVLQIISENISTNKITLYLVDVPKKHGHVNKIRKNLQAPHDVDLNIINVTKDKILQSKNDLIKPDVLVMHDILADKKILEDLYHTIPANTFIISIGLDSTGLYPSSIYQKVSSFGKGHYRVELAKFRPTPPSYSTTAITIRSMSDLPQLRTAFEQLPKKHKLLVLAPYPAPSGLKEQVKAWRKNGGKNVSMVMFHQKYSLDKEFENIPDVAFSILHEGTWGGEYYIPTKLEAAASKSVVSLTCTRPGDLSSLTWVETDITKAHGIDVTVHYAGLVGRDAARAQGAALTHSEHDGFGMDFSGVTASGERVMGLLARGSVASKVKANLSTLWPVPAHWTLEDAATVPFAYCYALYILFIKWQPGEANESILINGGCGALGQALISVSLALGLDVFVTVSDVRKKRFLKKIFPELKADHIGNSRDITFKDMIMRGTCKYPRGLNDLIGAHLVVNCTSGPLRHDVINCCSDLGTIIDTAQLTTNENFPCGMASWNKKTYSLSDFSSVFNDGNQMELRKLQLLLSEGIVKGFVRPLSRVTYAPHEISRAFRLLAASQHRGRVLIDMQESPVGAPRVSCKTASSCLVIFENEYFGAQLTDLLVRRGANKLHLHANVTSYLKFKIRHWEEQGVRIVVSSKDLKSKRETMSLLEECNGSGSLDGVYFAAVRATQKPETIAAILTNLDKVSRKVSLNLKHFAVISEEDSSWRDLITERAQNGLPSLSLVLPKLKQFDLSGDEVNATGVDVRSALEILEEALCSGDHLVTAQVLPNAPGSILEEVAKIPGLSITSAIVDRTSLEKVGVDSGRATELSHVLRERFNITVPPELLPAMTIGQLKNLKKEYLDIEQDLPGFGGYISVVDEDEMRATTEVVLMPTLVHRSAMRPDEFDLNQNSLCILPGLEGHHDRFRTLCERLKIPAVVFQYGHSHLSDTLQEAAQRIADSIMKCLAPKQTFYLLGYEFGVMLSLEVAAILESYGMIGTVYLLGGTPEDIQKSFISRWKDSSKESMQDALLLHMYSIITNTSSVQLEDDLRRTNSWPKKLEVLIKACRVKVPFTSQYVRGITEGINARIEILQSYNTTQHKLKSKIILMQAKPYKTSENILKTITNQEPIVKNLTATLAYAHKDLKVSNIINSYLGNDVIREYNSNNQCETALVNEDDYVKLCVS